MPSVLCVCLGNICRSPMCEALLRFKLSERGDLAKWKVDSAGTGGWHVGDLPDSRTIETCTAHGVPCTGAARKLRKADGKAFDFILVMDDNNLSEARRICGADATATIVKVRHYDPIRPNADVDDPYYGGSDGFERIFTEISRSLDQFLEKEYPL